MSAGTRRRVVISVVATIGVTLAAGCEPSSPNDRAAIAPPTTPGVSAAPTAPAASALPAAPGVTSPPSTLAATRPPAIDPAPASVDGSRHPNNPRRPPFRDGVRYTLGGPHAEYPATDIFAACGTEVVSPVDGVIASVRTDDRWEAGVDNPATRGGLSVAIVGYDGVRYYLSHFAHIDLRITPGRVVSAGQFVGQVGRSGRAGACHVHFGLSPPCEGNEWLVRRGVVPPAGYLRAWASGWDASPAEEVAAWTRDHEGACEFAELDAHAADA